jgi:circadian clock protein KaiB
MAKSKDEVTTQVVSVTSDSLPSEYFVLRLYIAGLSPRSTMAVERIRRICDHYLVGRYELNVIDLFVNPELAREAQIVVAPTLIKQSPSPKRLFIGDMSDEKTIFHGLNIVVSSNPRHC